MRSVLAVTAVGLALIVAGLTGDPRALVPGALVALVLGVTVRWGDLADRFDRLDALVHAMHSVAKIVEPASVASPTELRIILSSGHNGLRGATLRQLGVVNQ